MNGKTVIQSGQTAAAHAPDGYNPPPPPSRPWHAPSVRSINVERGTGGGHYYSVYLEDTYFFPKS